VCINFGKAHTETARTFTLPAVVAGDEEKRLSLCSDFGEMLRNTNWIDEAFLSTDELTFHLCGKLNRQNV
jgi:hypothetical protein